MATSTLPAVGELFDFTESTGYVPLQCRPSSCKMSCRCEGRKCNGTTTVHRERVESVRHFMDNSIEIWSESGRMKMHTYPHGDACY